MLLYLTVTQMLSLFASHLFQTKTASSILLILWMLAMTSVGGYTIHIGDIPSHLWWSEMLSPERWLLPVIVADEYSVETLSNTAGQQLCRNKQVCIVVMTMKHNNLHQLLMCHRTSGPTPGNHCATPVSGTEWHQNPTGTLATTRKSHSRC